MIAAALLVVTTGCVCGSEQCTTKLRVHSQLGLCTLTISTAGRLWSPPPRLRHFHSLPLLLVSVSLLSIACPSAASVTKMATRVAQQPTESSRAGSPPSGPSSPPTHPLSSSFTFSYLDKHSITHQLSYSDSIKPLGHFTTLESFYPLYTHLHRPSALPHSLTLHLFRSHIDPTWEHPANARGGKCMLRLRKHATDRCWEECVLALVGDSFGLGEEVCGLVLSMKAGEDMVSVWNRNAEDKDAVMRIKSVLMRVLGVERVDAFDYRPHDVSIKSLHTLNPHASAAFGGGGGNSSSIR